jgi:hypothetical protein
VERLLKLAGPIKKNAVADHGNSRCGQEGESGGVHRERDVRSDPGDQSGLIVFPPRQKLGSFSFDQLLEKLKWASGCNQ